MAQTVDPLGGRAPIDPALVDLHDLDINAEADRVVTLAWDDGQDTRGLSETNDRIVVIVDFDAGITGDCEVRLPPIARANFGVSILVYNLGKLGSLRDDAGTLLQGFTSASRGLEAIPVDNDGTKTWLIKTRISDEGQPFYEVRDASGSGNGDSNPQYTFHPIQTASPQGGAYYNITGAVIDEAAIFGAYRDAPYPGSPVTYADPDEHFDWTSLVGAGLVITFVSTTHPSYGGVTVSFRGGNFGGDGYMDVNVDGVTIEVNLSNQLAVKAVSTSLLTDINLLATTMAGTGLEQFGDTLRIAAAAAGDGLTGGAGSPLAVQTNWPIVVTSDQVTMADRYAVATGTGGAYSVSYTNPPTALANGQVFFFQANHDAGGAATFKVNSFTAYPIQTITGDALTSGQVVNGQIVELLFLSNTFRVLSTLAPEQVAADPGVSHLVQIGAIQPWAGGVSNIPDGYLLCNGSEISRTTYANLFSAIGTRWGTGDGSTTFNLPDLRDVFLAGAREDDAGVAKTNITGSLLQTGGSTTTGSGEGSHDHGGATGSTVLTVDQIPAHSHTSALQTTNESGAPPNISGVGFVSEPAASSQPTTGSAGGGQGHTHTIASDDSGTHTHTLVPPFAAIVYMIRAL